MRFTPEPHIRTRRPPNRCLTIFPQRLGFANILRWSISPTSLLEHALDVAVKRMPMRCVAWAVLLMS
jgi:hypothetical protein